MSSSCLARSKTFLFLGMLLVVSAVGFVFFGPYSPLYATTAANNCGNGKVDHGEQCDDGNMTSGDGCSECKKDAGYVCSGSPSQCRKCGNGRVEAGEGCDDGNMTSGDGCNSRCKIEASYTCNKSSPSVCTSNCGNGVLETGEQCDDGNTTSGDGCSNKCKKEAGYQCTGSPSQCQKCGNGKVEAGEDCDDVNTNTNDGCSKCKIEAGFTCNGSPSVCDSTCKGGQKWNGQACACLANLQQWDGSECRCPNGLQLVTMRNSKLLGCWCPAGEAWGGEAFMASNNFNPPGSCAPSRRCSSSGKGGSATCHCTSQTEYTDGYECYCPSAETWDGTNCVCSDPSQVFDSGSWSCKPCPAGQTAQNGFCAQSTSSDNGGCANGMVYNGYMCVPSTSCVGRGGTVYPDAVPNPQKKMCCPGLTPVSNCKNGATGCSATCK